MKIKIESPQSFDYKTWGCCYPVAFDVLNELLDKLVASGVFEDFESVAKVKGAIDSMKSIDEERRRLIAKING